MSRSMRREALPLCKATEEELYLFGIVFSPTPSRLTSHVFQKFDCVRIPATKSLHDEGFEGDALRAAVVEVSAVFGGLLHLNGGGSIVRGAVHNGVLSGGNDADVKGDLLSVDP